MSWLERLRKHKDDRGMMADLRCLLVENKKHRAWPALSRLGISIDNEVLSFVAGLYAAHPDETTSGNFGTTCKRIELKRDEKPAGKGLTPTERRLQQVLAAEREEVYDRVQRMVRMAKSHDLPINYEQLATDLRFWGDRTKTDWASAFWNPAAKSNDEENPT